MPAPITPELIYLLTSVSDPALFPDGSRLVFVRSKVDREAMETRSQVMVMSLPGGEPTPLSGGTAGSFPRFS